jgi:hypothetical protein
MKKEIQELREVIAKLVPLLTGKGLVVTQRGTKAYVSVHRVTKKPERVNIPNVSDNADADFIRAIQGFIDHECAHVLYTDWESYLLPGDPEDPKIKRQQNMVNIIEDTFIERRIVVDLPGARRNLSDTRRFFLERVTGPALASAATPQEQLSYLIVPMMRALAGHEEMQEFMDKNGYWSLPLIKALRDKMPEKLVKSLPELKHTRECVAVALEIDQILYPPPPAPPVLESVDPAEVSTAGNDKVSIYGDHLREVREVRIGGKRCPRWKTVLTSAEAAKTGDLAAALGGGSHILAITPKLDPGVYDVEVVTDAGRGVLPAAFTFVEPPAKPASEEDEDGKSEDKPDKKADEGDGKGERDHSESEPGDEGAGASSDDADDDESEGDSSADKGKPGKPKKGDKEKDEGAGDEKDEDDPAAGSDESSDDGKTGDEEDDKDADDAGADEDDAESGSDEGSDDEDGDAGEDDVAPEADEDDERDGEGAGDGEDEDESEDSDGAAASSDAADVDEDEDDGAGDAGSGDEEDADEDDGSGDVDDGEAGEDIQFDDHDWDAASLSDDDSDEEGEPGVGGDKSSKSMFDLDDDALEDADLSKAICVIVTNDAINSMSRSDYTVYTREFDRIEHYDAPPAGDAYIPRLEEEVRSMVGKMQKDIERMLAAQSQVIRNPGLRSGRLHAPNLHRLMAGDDRIFYRKAEHKSKDTAVTLMIDNSGSMNGAKCQTAMVSGYALSSTLDRCNIPHEVLGFTTGGFDVPRSIYEGMLNEMRETGIRFNRQIPIHIPIYKDFDERISPMVKRRIATMAYSQVGLAGNIDGESLEYGAVRLLKRREKRKVMIVLSDGHPVEARDASAHLKLVVKDLTKIGIEMIGIGIKDNAVRSFYPKHVVLNNLNDLPGQVMNELKAILA